ncbi:ribonuclease H-like domain-containing protein [Favolaschia claudopus]|uniref:Ribonuclease H-like domain-containing protein n=1 Tax=Favolaschia claudopus TaxID=2862362 RepID=A0AAV9ZNM0_9AGAR
MSYKNNLELLRLYLSQLPPDLPLEQPADQVNKLLHFSPDSEWVASTGEEAAVNRELETAFWQYTNGRRAEDGSFPIPSRGAAIESLPTILEFWLERYPQSHGLQRWLSGALLSASNVILAHNLPLPTLPAVIPTTAPLATAKPRDGQQTTLTGTVVPGKQKKSKKGANSDPKPTGKKPETKLGGNGSDPLYVDIPEEDDDRTGGRKIDPLLLKISKLWKDEDEKIHVRCLASAGCRTTWAYPRNKQRILRHAMGCGWLAAIDSGSLVAEAIAQLKQKDPGLLDRLNAQMGLPSKRQRDESEPNGSSGSNDAPPLKRVKSTPQPSQPPAAEASQSAGPFGKYQTEGRKQLNQKVNDALVELIVCCGLRPRLIGRDEFKKLINSLNPTYNVVSRTQFEDSLAPSYAASVRVAVLDYLATCRHLTLSADGGKLVKKKFISVHVTTIHRQSFCVELDDVARLSQSAEYFKELFVKWILKIGPSRFSALDLCNIPAFQLTIAGLREVLALMSLSSYALDWFDDARKQLKIAQGLESVGETRFGTIYWSLHSVLEGIPAFVSIVRNPELGIDSEVLRRYFLDEEDTFKFKQDLTRLGAVLMPFARAIQCLECKDTTPADVYKYWLAVVAQLNDLITKDDKAGPKSKYETTVKELIRSIANFRFSQLFESKHSSNAYFTAFVLDPDNRGASILSTPNPLAVQPIRISISSGQPAVQPPAPLIERVGLSLMEILRKEYGEEYSATRTIEQARAAMEDINPHIAQRTPSEALKVLKPQLEAYLAGAEPFHRKRKPTQSNWEWWVSLLGQPDSDILAALGVKLFSSNPVSMPDERAMSTVTWMNSKDRNRQDVSTVSNYLAIRGFHRMDMSHVPRKPVTVNWRDIKATIHGKPHVEKAAANTEEANTEPERLEVHDEVKDPLAWLNAGLPDLRTAGKTQFDLAAEFDLEQYLHILASSVEGSEATAEVAEGGKEQDRERVAISLKAAADSVAPKEDQWSSWGAN